MTTHAIPPHPLLTLAADPTGRSLGLDFDLPPGTLHRLTLDGLWHEPLLWRATEPTAEETWGQLLPALKAAGLQPVLLGGARETDGDQPWDEELGPDMATDPDEFDAAELLAEWWADNTAPVEDEERGDATAPQHDAREHDGPRVAAGGTGTAEDTDAADAADDTATNGVVDGLADGEDEDAGPARRGTGSAADEVDDAEALAPYGIEWPGLAQPRIPLVDPDERAAEVAAALVEYDILTAPRIALVPAERSADILAAIGWLGTLNYDNDAAPFSAVLRSWEDRFGIRVVALEFDVLHVSVPHPPRTLEEALPIAAEHFAFCPDNIWQDSETLEQYAREHLVDKHNWSFWWD
ncbi:DUF4253 domain-containing protein [Streptomyces zagrosensis]|uniref:DUF4253 domain-containing protein n=1 Tax=Streptomyces zagrosensis TaxID=1042984 RepID=A0A7W9Q4F1_9ACTN|nr:DUF4253 domain-containing protein [Streptomyces zagrosensis]MBB5933340.1 hypothetical protein [Streptomyces zagrosensis]